MLRPGLVLLLAALLLAGCQPKVTRPACPAGKLCLEYGNNSEALTLDPQKANLLDEAAIISDLIYGLTTDDPEGRPIPALAKSWEITPDGLTWTFHLRDATWSDGVPITADDFVFAYRRILAPETASIYAYLVFLLKNGEAVNAGKAAPDSLGARALDPHTLQLTLEHPAPYLPQLLKHQSFFPVPRHVVEKYGDDWVKPGKFVGSGPFNLVDWKLGDYIRVEKNPRFYDADQVCLDRINYYPTSDSVMAERRIKRGELDVNTSFQSNRIDRLRREMPQTLRTHTSLATSYISLNTSGIKAFRDVRVRRAMAMAVDREFITAKLMRAGQVPAYAFVPPGTDNYVAGPRLRWADMPFAERQAEARRLMAEAGYAKGLTVDMVTSSSPATLLVSQSLQADWAAIGVRAKLVQNESQIAFEAYRNRAYGIGLMSWYADFNDPVTFLDLLRSTTGGQNYGDYKNPAYDALLDRANLEPDAARRAQILAEAEQMILDDQAIIPVYFVVNLNLVSPKVTGWVDNAANFHRARWLCLKR